MNRLIGCLVVVICLLSMSHTSAMADEPTNVPNRTASISVTGALPSEWGKQIGEAVNSVKDAFISTVHESGKEVNDFADTKIGKWATYAIAWKVVGNDFMRILHTVYIRIVGTTAMVIVFRYWWKLLGSTSKELLLGKDDLDDGKQFYCFVSVISGVLFMIGLFLCLFG